MLIINHKINPSKVRVNINKTRRIDVVNKIFSHGDISLPTSAHCHVARKSVIAQYRILNKDDTPIYWRDDNNTIHKFTPKEFMELYVAFDAFIDEIHYESWREKHTLLNDELPEELKIKSK